MNAVEHASPPHEKLPVEQHVAPPVEESPVEQRVALPDVVVNSNSTSDISPVSSGSWHSKQRYKTAACGPRSRVRADEGVTTLQVIEYDGDAATCARTVLV